MVHLWVLVHCGQKCVHDVVYSNALKLRAFPLQGQWPFETKQKARASIFCNSYKEKFQVST